MRKGRDGGNGKNGKKKKRGKKKEKNTDENSGHYVIASSRPPERRPLERRTLAPKPVTFFGLPKKTTMTGALWLFLCNNSIETHKANNKSHKNSPHNLGEILT